MSQRPGITLARPTNGVETEDSSEVLVVSAASARLSMSGGLVRNIWEESAIRLDGIDVVRGRLDERGIQLLQRPTRIPSRKAVRPSHTVHVVKALRSDARLRVVPLVTLGHPVVELLREADAVRCGCKKRDDLDRALEQIYGVFEDLTLFLRPNRGVIYDEQRVPHLECKRLVTHPGFQRHEGRETRDPCLKCVVSVQVEVYDRLHRAMRRDK